MIHFSLAKRKEINDRAEVVQKEESIIHQTKSQSNTEQTSIIQNWLWSLVVAIATANETLWT